MSSFLDPLIVTPNDDERNWTLVEQFRYWLTELHKGDVLTIPIGFITDFASIPQIFWNILPPTGKYGKAAVVHDYLYQNLGNVVVSPKEKEEWEVYCEEHNYSMDIPLKEFYKTFTRQECDQILLDAMEVLGVGYCTKYIIYYGVRVGGWHAWNQHLKEKLKK